MLRTFHRLQRYLAYFVLVCAIALAFSGFGFNLFQQRDTSKAAVTVGDAQLSFTQYASQVRALEERYRKMFGENFDLLAQQLKLNIGQQVTDRYINETLTNNIASTLGFHSGEQEFIRTRKEQLFPEGYSRERYADIIRASGLSQEELEKAIRDGNARAQLVNLFKDASLPAESEVRAIVQKRETTYNASYLALEPEDFVKETKAPTTEQIAQYYEEHKAEFEVAPRIAYSYAVFSPADFTARVEVPEEEIELYYTDNLTTYTLPEERKLRHIQILYSADKDPAKMAAVKTRAEEVLVKAQAGESFDALALQYSDDVTTKTLGGDLGWVAKGSRDAEFEATVFGFAGEGLTPLVSTPFGYHIVKVEGRKEAKPRALEEVRGSILKLLQERDAPSYAADKARELYDVWTKGSSETLASVVAAHGITAQDSKKLLRADEDANPLVKGLTAKVIEYQEGEDRLLIELGALSVLVQVTERRDVETLSLAEATPEIVDTLRLQEATAIATKKAEAVIAAKAFAKGAKVSQAEGVTVAKGDGPFAQEDLRGALVAVKNVDAFLEKPYTVGDTIYVVQLKKITSPTDDVVKSKMAQYREQLENEHTDLLVDTVLAREKLKSDIEVNPAIVTP
jgi:peptidyl-prolyl cis-trans isomerase D